jgi:hypothetical protein
MNNTEEWRDVLGFEGLYEVSSLGRVNSFARNGTRGGILKREINRGGYVKVVLSKNDKTSTHVIHRLMAIAFFGDNPRMQVNHKNGAKADNRIENLEWCTAQQNTLRAHRTGLASKRPGEKNSNSKLTEIQVIEIFHAAGRYRDIGAIHGITPENVYSIKNGKTWKHLNLRKVA